MRSHLNCTYYGYSRLQVNEVQKYPTLTLPKASATVYTQVEKSLIFHSLSGLTQLAQCDRQLLVHKYYIADAVGTISLDADELHHR